MIKKMSLISCLALALLSACQANQAIDPNGKNIGVQGKGEVSFYQRMEPNKQNNLAGKRTSIFNFSKPPTKEIQMGANKFFGFVEHNKKDADVVYYGYGAEYYLDRKMLADAISKMAVSAPDVHKASVLVSTDTCLIGYKPNPNSQVDVHDQMIKTGMSVTPRWYKVYATDDPKTIAQMQQIAHAFDNGKMSQRELIKQVKHLTKAHDGKVKYMGQDHDGMSNQDLGYTHINK